MNCYCKELRFKYGTVPESASGIVLSDLQVSNHMNFARIFRKYTEVAT